MCECVCVCVCVCATSDRLVMGDNGVKCHSAVSNGWLVICCPYSGPQIYKVYHLKIELMYLSWHLLT